MTTPTTKPPRLPIPNGAQLSVRLNQGGQVAVCVLGSTLPSVGVTTGAAEQWLGAFFTAMKPLMHTGVVCLGATMRDVSGPDGRVAEAPAPALSAGTGGAAVALASGATLIKWATATGGRTGKGRTYIPGLGSGAYSTDGRSYVPSHVTNTQTAINAYLSNTIWANPDWKPAVLSFRRGETRVITGGAISSVVGTQRRRMR